MDLLYDPEEIIMCPYDKFHRIRRCKMAFHIVKCKKNFGEQRRVRCDFNATHMIPERELQYHLDYCPDRKTIEEKIVDTHETYEDKYPVVTTQVVTQETWDDLDCPAYDPIAATDNRQVLRHLDVESAAKRKQFRMSERKRFSQLENNENPSLHASTSSSSPSFFDQKVELPKHERVTHLEMMQKINQGSKELFVPNKPK